MPDPDLVLVHAPRGRDGVLAVQLLARHGIAAIGASVDELIDGITQAGCAVIAAESLTHAGCARIASRLVEQPPWSDFPIVLLVPRGTDRGDQTLAAATLLGNVTVLERPVQSGTLVSAVVGGLRGRRRQYEARAAIERRDQFLAMLGHELRNPLASITLAVDSLATTSCPERHHAILERQTRHLARLVDDLLDVARVTSGKVTLRCEIVDVVEILQSCIGSVQPAGRSIGLSVASSARPVFVDGDPVRLEEVFNNLLTNATKYSAADARIDVLVTRANNRCVVEVRDTGIGIAPDMLPHVFDLFAQAKQTLDRSQGGLGIGLTLVRSLVELHGGTIDARSEGIGRGSSFVVELPCARDALRSAAAVVC